MYNEKADVYSAGTILYEMLFGCLPFEDKSIPGMLKKIKSAFKSSQPPGRLASLSSGSWEVFSNMARILAQTGENNHCTCCSRCLLVPLAALAPTSAHSVDASGGWRPKLHDPRMQNACFPGAAQESSGETVHPLKVRAQWEGRWRPGGRLSLAKR